VPTALLHLRTHGVVVTQGFRDRILRHPSPRARSAAASGTDLSLTTPDRLSVQVTISDRYGPTPTAQQAAQNTVNLLASRVHGTELGALRVFIGPPDEIGSICGGQEALACYAPGEQRMYAPGENPPSSPVPVEYIITHEFGHHIANHRRNALGPAFTLGPEYWADVAVHLRRRAEPIAGVLPRRRGRPLRGPPGSADRRYRRPRGDRGPRR
jgi:hypothetical protein